MADYSYLDPVINALEDAFEEHESTLMEFIGKMGKSLYPMTYFALMSFIPKIESLRIGIFNLVEIDEYYSEKILFRCCCEHFLKFQYIFIRFINEKNDDVGRDYFLFGDAKEKLDFAASMRFRAELVGKSLGIDAMDLLSKFDSRLENISKAAIDKECAKFTVKSMIRELNEITNKNKNQEPPFLGIMATAYSELSSYVHGGPEAGRESSQLYPDKNLITFSEEPAIALQMSAATKFFTFMAYGIHDEKLMEIARKIDKIIRETQKMPGPSINRAG